MARILTPLYVPTRVDRWKAARTRRGIACELEVLEAYKGMGDFPDWELEEEIKRIRARWAKKGAIPL